MAGSRLSLAGDTVLALVITGLSMASRLVYVPVSASRSQHARGRLDVATTRILPPTTPINRDDKLRSEVASFYLPTRPPVSM